MLGNWKVDWWMSHSSRLLKIQCRLVRKQIDIKWTTIPLAQYVLSRTMTCRVAALILYTRMRSWRSTRILSSDLLKSCGQWVLFTETTEEDGEVSAARLESMTHLSSKGCMTVDLSTSVVSTDCMKQRLDSPPVQGPNPYQTWNFKLFQACVFRNPK